MLLKFLSLLHFAAAFSFQNDYPGVYQLSEPVDHSECPTWDSRNNMLYFVNINQGEIYRYDYENDEIQMITLHGQVAPVIPSRQDPYLLIAGVNRSVVAVEWDNPSEARVLTTVSNQFPTSRFNDGKADKNGRLWIGTMGTVGVNQGVLYQITCENLDTPLVEVAPVNISNGLAWNADNDKFYYIDTPTGYVVEYDYDNDSGEISNKRVAFDINKYNQRLTGSPDGMTIDEDDNLWIALFGGGSVIKVNASNGELLQVVPLPAQDVSSAMWGGPNLDILFVTTSRVYLSEEERKQQPSAGAVFAVVGLKTKGRPVFEVNLLDSIDSQGCDNV